MFKNKKLTFSGRHFSENIKNYHKLFLTLNLIRNSLKIYLSDQSNFNENRFNIKRATSLVIFIVFQLYLFTGCSPFRKGNELIKFESLQFSFQDQSNSRYLSVLFSQSDTVFLKKYSHFNKDSIFYSIFPDSDRSIINASVISFNSSAFHPLKLDSIEHFNPCKAKFSLYIDYSDENQHFDFDGLPPPIAFKKFNNWVNTIIERLQFNFVDTLINFKEDNNIHKAMNERNR